MFFADRLSYSAPRRTSDGYLAVRAKTAKAGVQDYLGYEVDPEGKHFAANDRVPVYRPESEVFAADAVASFLLKPITNDHPSVAVTAENWKDHAKGVAAKALRDGDHLAFDLVLMDAATIRDVESGKKELSGGYACHLDIGDGIAPDGTPFKATQRAIRGNHIAVVKAGRAGPECRIGDTATCQPLSTELLDRLLTDGAPKMPHTLIIDGLQVPNVSDEAKAAIEKLQKALGDSAAQVAVLTTDKSTLEAKVVTLDQQAKDAKLTPAQLRDAAKEYALTVDKAKALGVTVTDAMDEPAIQRATVSAKIGDAAKDWSDAQVAASFATLTADVKSDPLRSAIRDAAPRAVVTDTAQIRDAARAARYA